ncbi:sulfotransferase [Roseibium aggregatum]|uniref:Sulfotransferase family protein n=1 Tax=Roseibium aggregatum TaxID=187304 RepID=A0A939ECA7_9HYPH|nr:sulfotransferase [Roseibium aggregatum]MBN9670323.1 hypothetical protein [Roseibium aggregatum]
MTPQEFSNAVSWAVIANKNFNKIFCIGDNKTGTTTLERVLRLYGYHLPDQQEQEIRLTKRVFETDYTELTRFCSRYDAFQDMPFSQGLTYVAADALFPNSKFILTERDPESWFSSLVNFHKKIYGIEDINDVSEKVILEKFNYLYPGYVHTKTKRFLTSFDGRKKEVQWEKIYDKDYYIDLYESRNLSIKKYFADTPEKLLIIDVTKERDTSKICDFLNIPGNFAIDMPHENKT